MLDRIKAPAIKALATLVAFAVAIGAVWLFGEARHAQGAAEARAERSQEDLQGVLEQAQVLSENGEKLADAVSELSNLGPKVVTEYRYVKQKVPLPDGCLPDAGRMRSIEASIDKINSAR